MLEGDEIEELVRKRTQNVANGAKRNINRTNRNREGRQVQRGVRHFKNQNEASSSQANQGVVYRNKGVDHRNSGNRGKSVQNNDRKGTRNYKDGVRNISRAETQQMDWLHMREKPSQNERHMTRANSVDNVTTILNFQQMRSDYGGRYNLEYDNQQAESSRGNAINRSKQSRPYKPDRKNIGFKKLEDICEMDPDKIIVIISNEETGFDKLLKQILTPDYIVLLLKLVKKVCDSAFHENKSVIFVKFCQKEFLDQLSTYISSIVVQGQFEKNKNRYFWNDPEQFWVSVYIIFDTILNLQPNLATEVLPKIIKLSCISLNTIEQYQNVIITDALKNKFEGLKLKIMISVEERQKKKMVENRDVQDEEPPDDFRHISLYPLTEEITNPEKAFIRPIIVRGRYKSVEHYLDVQFRLLREDFVAPLREGVCSYIHQLQGSEKKRLNDVRVYEKVQFVKVQNIKDRIAMVVQINMNKNKKFNLENSRRFMYGSLVCFTDNNFQKIIFGTICDRNIELLKIGQIVVDVTDDIIYNHNYIMIECNIYFEPYYYVLKALQNIDAEIFPFARYIIEVLEDNHPPQYFMQSPMIEYQGYHFPVLATDLWPKADKLYFDDSQYRAFKNALTKEFCIIQGPPGTGKTYIGLQISKVLIHNAEYWHKKGGPILVICFTNHALDQFLEGIMDFTKDIVRIGGQSRNTKMKQFNLKELRLNKPRSRDTGSLLFKKRSELKMYLCKIKGFQGMLDAVTANDRIINISEFESVDENLKNSWFSTAKSNEILDWFFGGHTAKQRTEERNKFNKVEANEEGDSDDDSYDPFYAEEMENMVDDKEDLGIEIDSTSISKITLILLKTFEEKKKNLKDELNELDKSPDNALKLYDEKEIKKEELDEIDTKLMYLKLQFDRYKHNEYPNAPETINYIQPFDITLNERWGMYWKWLNLYRNLLTEQIQIWGVKFRASYRQYEEVLAIEDTRLIKEMLVVGMTTTGAARHQKLLQALKCQIVIVEEAAEVLESHIVVSLTNACQHLILIGDHQQLHPTTAVYRLAKKFNLEISLFERMVSNGIHCSQLEVQHRMRPEIASLIAPAIYEKLDNHHSVYSYPSIKGVTSNLFFITHNEPEQEISEGNSKRNVHEAKFLIKLANHLILQGYTPSEITILTTYTGQMFYLWQERKSYPNLEDVRIIVVDNFQGEENKIILLSLVRSNKDGVIGFLKTENRVCVALSRAKEGFFIIGNMEILEQNNTIWPKIKETLEQQGNIGTHLSLRCQNHPDQITQVRMHGDFQKISEGGCSILCNKELDCGHICKSLCHFIDREHKIYSCKELCKRTLCELDHPCPDLCYMECKPCLFPMTTILKCGHTHEVPCHMNVTEYLCSTLVPVELACGHKTVMPCHRDIKTFPCSHKCEIRLQCGHTCTRNCHIDFDPDHLQFRCLKPCAKSKVGCSTNTHSCPMKCFEECLPCEIFVKKQRTVCIHVHVVACNLNVDEIQCEKRCDKIKVCGHKCRLKCFEECGKCEVQVNKISNVCKHSIKTKCFQEPDQKLCQKKCPLLLSCGHMCSKKCNEPCNTQCMVLIDNPKPTACGHQFKIPCFKLKKDLAPTSLALLKHCTEPCSELLMCKHRCKGSCGKCSQGRIHHSCQEKCGATLICGHDCNIPCRETCQPCNKRCTYRCNHSQCGKKCGEPCTDCAEKCERRCEHKVCRNLCGAVCSVPPCTEPCQKNLRCHHPCIGFCGDPCPPICRFCNSDDDTFKILFGNEDEPDARFILLQECGHCIESNAMDQWMQQSGEEIKVKHCPRCKTTITRNQRYSEYIKDAYTDIQKVKSQNFGNYADNEEQRIRLLAEITRLAGMNLLTDSKYLKKLLNSLRLSLEVIKNGKRNPINAVQLNTCETQVEIVERIINIFRKCDLKTSQSLAKCVSSADFLLYILLNQKDRITQQEIADLQLELLRFENSCHLFKIEASILFKQYIGKEDIRKLYDKIINNINSVTKFSAEQDKQLKHDLKVLTDGIDKSIQVTPEERKMIVKAMGMSQGHWYKCPNGHIYCIGECGGATEISKCNICGAQIGGTSHRLLANNTHAGEMDGSTAPAWSNAANMNMNNYQFHD